MQTTLTHHINRLRLHYGSYSRAAGKLGIDIRSFRRAKNGGMSTPSARFIVACSKSLALRQLLRVLVASGDLDRKALARAWKQVLGSRS